MVSSLLYIDVRYFIFINIYSSVFIKFIHLPLGFHQDLHLFWFKGFIYISNLDASKISKSCKIRILFKIIKTT